LGDASLLSVPKQCRKEEGTKEKDVIKTLLITRIFLYKYLFLSFQPIMFSKFLQPKIPSLSYSIKTLYFISYSSYIALPDT